MALSMEGQTSGHARALEDLAWVARPDPRVQPPCLMEDRVSRTNTGAAEKAAPLPIILYQSVHRKYSV